MSFRNTSQLALHDTCTNVGHLGDWWCCQWDQTAGEGEQSPEGHTPSGVDEPKGSLVHC